MILLKKQLDEVLKKYNLPDLTVQKMPGSTMIQLCSPCGKPVAYVPNGVISGTKLTFDEREYVFSVVSKFIIENVKEIKKAIDIVINPTEYPEHPEYEISGQTAWNGNGKDTKVAEYGEVELRNRNNYTDITIRYYHDGKVKIECREMELETLQSILVERVPEMVKLAMKAFDICEKKQKESNFLKNYTTCRY